LEGAGPGLTRGVAMLFAVACGLAVANVYFAQPLLDAMADDFGIDHAIVGIIVTVAQIGYGLGLLLLVPLGDLLDRRRLIVSQSLLSVVALLTVGTATSTAFLLAGMAALGLMAVVTQVLVAYAAGLAAPGERGRIVGTVTSGIIIGILLARTAAGSLADLAGWRAIYLASAGATLIITALLYRHLPVAAKNSARTSYPRLLASVFALFLAEPILRIRAILAMLTFAAVVVLWTPMVLPLSAPPHSLSHTEIGLFGLAGAAGALAASRTGQLADRGLGQWVTAGALLLMLISWLPISYADKMLWPLILGVVIIDLALQAVHVTNQTMIYAVRPEARSRLTAAYMIFYSIGSAGGSIASTMVYAWAGWHGVCLLGAALSAVAFLFWAATFRVKPRPD
jgi:predicted MFS family arabinose efflux permease